MNSKEHSCKQTSQIPCIVTQDGHASYNIVQVALLQCTVRTVFALERELLAKDVARNQTQDAFSCEGPCQPLIHNALVLAGDRTILLLHIMPRHSLTQQCRLLWGWWWWWWWWWWW